MLESYVSNDFSFTDLNLYECGIEDCFTGQAFGPAVRDHYLIHYILKGSGVFKVFDTVYNLSKGQGFLICPYKVSSYKSDIDNPWTYAWVGFNGEKAEEFLRSANICFENPIFKYQEDDFLKSCFYDIIACKPLGNGRNLRIQGYLYLLLSQLLEKNGNHPYNRNENMKELYVRKAKEYILKNFSRKIIINEISSYIGIDRSYLCHLFKAIEHMSPQEYLINFRVHKAIELMAISELSIADISRSVGYDDPFIFSKLFKRTMGLSPKHYRYTDFSSCTNK